MVDATAVKEIPDLNDPRVAKALAHPLRLRILAILERRVATPKDLATELDASLEALSYHVRSLAQSGLIELVERRQKRGAVEHHYRAVPRPHLSAEAWHRVPETARTAAVGSSLAQIGELASAAALDGGFDHREAHVARRALTLDAAGFEELSRALGELSERVADIERRAHDRLAEQHDGALQACLAFLLFETPPARRRPD